MARTEVDPQDLTTRVQTVSRSYEMVISIEKSKILENSFNRYRPTNIKINGQIIEVKTFKYLGFAIWSNDSSSIEIKTKLKMTLAAMTVNHI